MLLTLTLLHPRICDRLLLLGLISVDFFSFLHCFLKFSHLDVALSEIVRPSTIQPFQVHKTLSQDEATLRLFPGITSSTVRAFLSPPIKGVILETFGAGNAPNRPDILQALKQASDRGVVIVNCTQVKKTITFFLSILLNVSSSSVNEEQSLTSTKPGNHSPLSTSSPDPT